MKKSNRTIKNVIMILMIAVLCVGSYFTMDFAKNHTSTSNHIEMQMPSGDAQGGLPELSSDSDSSESESSSNQPPEMPSGENSDSSNRPERPGNHSESSDSDSASSEAFSKGRMGGMHQQGGKLKTVYYVLFACESLLIALILIYLIMSHFNKKSFKETFKSSDKVLIFALSTIIATSGLTVAQSAVTSKLMSGSNTGFSQRADEQMNNAASTSVDAAGSTTVTDEQTLEASYSSSNSDESAILVNDGGNATISGATVTKTGDSTNTENSEFYGINSGILVQESSTATIKNATISTDAKGSNAVFSTGENAKIYISESTITTTGSSSARGLDATYGGYIEADSVKITTQGGSCAALATDRGEGTVIANNSTLETNGAGSPLIYSTGEISVDSTKGTANGSQMVVIEGKNSASVTNSTLTASGAGNRKDVDRAGVMIYQSMSGDASEGTGTFTAASSSLSIAESSKYYKTAPMFFVTNTDAVINLNDTKLSFGSGVLLSVKATDEWGKEGSNGGNVTLNAKNQVLTGNIEADKLSTVAISLTNSSYEGTINGDNSAKEISLTLDKNSTIKLTGDCYVTSLENADSTNSNIDFNGFKLYVNGKAIN